MATGSIEWIYLDEVDSTNNYAKAQVTGQNVAVLADRQLAGKGRDGRHFVSHEGGMYLSVVRRDECPVEECARYMLAAPLAVCSVLSSLGVEAHIKWPNDVWIGRAKIAGVLIENEWQNGLVSRAIIGIGLNVNNDISDVPTVATSLAEQTAKRYSPRQLAEQIVMALDGYLDLPLDALVRDVSARLYNLGKTVVLSDGREGVAVLLAADGRLGVQCGGKIEYVAAGDVSLKEGLC